MWGIVGVQCQTRTGVEGLLPLLHSGPPKLPMSFSGTFDYTLDAKNRLTVPAKFRTSLTESLAIAQGTEKCLTIWPKRDFEEFVAAALVGTTPLDPKRDAIKRFFFSNSFDTELDTAGRVMIPSAHLEYAGLTKEVVVTGVGDRIEVWDRAAWKVYKRNLDNADLAALFAGVPAA